MKPRNDIGQFVRNQDAEIMYEGFAVYFDSKGYACVWLNGRDQKVHILEWEKENGPKPTGHELHHKDNNKGNFDIENLELLTNSDHQRVHAGWIRDSQGQWIEKPCTACKKVLPLSGFYPRKGYTPSARCRTCHIKMTKKWGENNIEKRREIGRNYWRRKNAREKQHECA